MGTISLYYHTLRHLKPSQVIWRLGFQIARPRIDSSPAPSLRQQTGDWVTPIVKGESFLGDKRFCFLNREAEVAKPEDWNRDDLPKLWLYNLHYFDFLGQDSLGADPAVGAEWMDRWIAENPAPDGNGWEPYTISLRIVNWIKWHLAGNELTQKQIDSLATQTRLLRDRLELHLLANHLFANAKALVFAGLFFGGAEAESWYQKGAAVLEQELDEQILPDGGHFERTPMYHSIILEDVLDMINLCRAFDVDESLRSKLQDKAQAMRQWLSKLCHPDGDIAYFNDSTSGIAPGKDELNAYALRLGSPADAESATAGLMESSGFARLLQGDCVLLADVGSVGPGYQPGHAHAGTLSFELSWQAKRLLVNSGISCYGVSEERLRQRQTAAHNALTVDGRDSSEVWSAHRVARRAQVTDLRLQQQDESTHLTAAHEGFRRLPGVGLHRRSWELAEKRLTITDAVDGTGSHNVEVYFHIHPDWTVHGTGANQFECRRGDCVAAVTFGEKVTVECAETTYHPGFGLTVPAKKLVARYDGPIPAQLVTTVSF